MTSKDFKAVVERRSQGGIALKMPFDPAMEWGERERYDVTGSVDGHKVRGKLISRPDGYYLELGPAWCRDEGLRGGELAAVSLQPEGPQVAAMDADIASALGAAPEARRFFRVAADVLSQELHALDSGRQTSRDASPTRG